MLIIITMSTVRSTLNRLDKYESRESESTTVFYHVNNIWVKFLGA